jgi:hypothetical protein
VGVRVLTTLPERGAIGRDDGTLHEASHSQPPSQPPPEPLSTTGAPVSAMLLSTSGAPVSAMPLSTRCPESTGPASVCVASIWPASVIPASAPPTVHAPCSQVSPAMAHGADGLHALAHVPPLEQISPDVHGVDGQSFSPESRHPLPFPLLPTRQVLLDGQSAFVVHGSRQ